MTKVHIPESVEALKQGLGGLDRLLTAKQWEKAAIVFAWTRGDGRGGKKADTATFTPTTFPYLSARQVGSYRAAWKSAANALGDDSLLDIEPGSDVTLPVHLPWKDHFGESTTDVQERVARQYIATHPKVVAEAVKAVPAVAEAVVKVVVEDRDLAEKHARVAFNKATTGKAVDKGPVAPSFIAKDYSWDKEVDKAVRVIHEAILKENAGTWKPDAGTGLMLALLTLNLKTREAAIAAARPPVFKEIDDFLAQNKASKA